MLPQNRWIFDELEVIHGRLKATAPRRRFQKLGGDSSGLRKLDTVLFQQAL
jgi:hypothetical protein